MSARSAQTLRRLASFLIFVVTSACGGSERPPRDLLSIAGCYALVRRDSPSVSLQKLIPDTVMLDTATKLNPDGRPYPRFPHVLRPLSHRLGAWADTIGTDDLAVPWPPDWEHAFVLKVWRFAAPDSVAALLHENMGPSWRLEFEAEGDSLMGAAQYYDDGSTTFTVPLLGRRVPCPSRSAAGNGMR